MLKEFARPALISAIVFNLSLNALPTAYAVASNPDSVPGLSTLSSGFTDFDKVSGYAKKAVVRLELLGLLSGESFFLPQQYANRVFARQVLGTLDDLGEGDVTYADAHHLIAQHFLYSDDAQLDYKVTTSFEGFLSKKEHVDTDLITREDFAYLVAHARELDIIKTGLPIHNLAIAAPGPLLGPTVYQSGTSNEGSPVFDGSTISLFHRAKDSLNTTFFNKPELTLQVHPEVFKSVSVGGIAVDSLQDLSAQLEVELEDGSVHRTPLTSLVPFSIHGADGKAGVIRIEDGILILADDLLGSVDSFELNGHIFSVEDTIERIKSLSYINGDKPSNEVVNVVINELNSKGFSLQDRRLMAHNLILAKTALQQSVLSPLSAPFNTIAGPSSASRGFTEGHLFNTYQLVDQLRKLHDSADIEGLRQALNDADIQQNLLTGTKILTAATLLPHITELSNAPFLPNEALSSRVKKSGALLPSEPISFQLDRLKRAAYILLDDALSVGKASHHVTFGEIVRRNDVQSEAFALSASNFEALPISVNQSVLLDALNDYSQAYEQLVYLISGVAFDTSLVDLDDNESASINERFSHSILSQKMASIKIGELDFKLDMLATPSHVRENLTPANNLTQGRQSEGFGLATALDPFPVRIAEYLCNGNVVTNTGEIIAEAVLNPEEQRDLISDFSPYGDTDCDAAINEPRYHQLLFVDNFQLPPFGPSAKFISTQGIEIINRLLLSPVDTNLSIADIRLSYRLSEANLNKTPSAIVNGPEQANIGEAIQLSANLSNDKDGNPLQYQWRVASGKATIIQSRDSAEATVTPKLTGDLVIELQVNDGIANSTVVKKAINVTAKGGGGSFSIGWLSLLALLGLVRRRVSINNHSMKQL